MRDPSSDVTREVFPGPSFEELSFDNPVTPDPEDHYTHYLDPRFPLEARLQAAMVERGVSEANQAGIKAFLAPLKEKHLPTYEHCIRVGLVASDIASFLQRDARGLLFAGALHDVGKIQAPLELLNKTSGWTEEDSRNMRRHVTDGYRMLRDRFDFAAEVALWHHRFQEAGYPAKLPPDLHDYSPGTKSIIPHYGKVLAIADTYDALHRINDKHGEKRALTGEEIKDRMLAFHGDSQQLIEDLYRAGVLTTYIWGEEHEETAALDEEDRLYQQSFTFTDQARTPDNTRRHIMIAAALEATSDKSGCTTRLLDISPHLKLEYFITAGINIGDAFARMAKAIDEQQGLPKGVFAYGYQAQLESKRNRRGGRINQGIIELLTPIVAAQHLQDPEYRLKPAAVLALATDLLEHTTREDVAALRKTKELAYQLSHYEREVPEHPDATNVREYYEAELLTSERATSFAHNGEFLRAFPTVADMCRTLEDCPYPHFSQRIQEAYHRARAAHDPEVASGFLADCIAVAVYLHLSQNPRDRLVG